MSDGFLGMFNVHEEINQYQPGDTAAGRRAETLIKTEGLRVVLVTMRAGITLHKNTPRRARSRSMPFADGSSSPSLMRSASSAPVISSRFRPVYDMLSTRWPMERFS